MRYIPTIIRGIKDDTEMLPTKDDLTSEELVGGISREGGRD